MTDPHQAMRDAHDRRFDREGIPMVLALFDERGPDARLDAVVAEPRAEREGAGYAELLGRFHGRLHPQARDADLWPAIVSVQALAVAHLLPGTLPDGPR